MSNFASSTKDDICLVHRAFPSTHRVLGLPNVCIFLYTDPACESWIICAAHSLHKCSSQGFGKCPCRGIKELWCSDPAPADISPNIVGHSRKTKSYLSMGILLACSNPSDKYRDKIVFSPLASLHFCSFCLSYPTVMHTVVPLTFSLRRPFNLFQLFKSPSWRNNDAAKHSGLQGLIPNQFPGRFALTLAPLRSYRNEKGPHYDSGVYGKRIINTTGGMETGR